MHVVVLGAGYAGLTLARELDDRLSDHDELTVVDDTGTHLVQHELHRLIRRPGLADELELPLASLLDEDVSIRQERVDAVDPDERSIALADGERLDYDLAAISLGADADFHGLDGLAEHATPLKRIEDAREIRAGVQPVLDANGRIVVGGAGLSGIQVAGELAEMRTDADSDASIVLLEQRDSVAPGFDPQFQRAVRRQLEARDVTVWTDASVESADADAIEFARGDPMAYDELIWTGGIRGDDAMDQQRPVVRSDLRLDERTFALGDAARVVDDHGELVPASARTAISQARVVASNVEAIVEHHRTHGAGSFTPRLDRYTMGQPRWLVSVGNGAVAQIGQAVLTGRAALALKTSVGAGYVGRVGPIRNAVDLVWSELGLGGDDPSTMELPRRKTKLGGRDDAPGGADDELAAAERDEDSGETGRAETDRAEKGRAEEGRAETDRAENERADSDGAADDREYDRLPDSVVEELTVE